MGFSLKNNVWTMNSSPPTTSIDLTPASSVSYTITANKLVGSGGIVDGWRATGSVAPTVTESSGELVLSAAISPSNVRAGLDAEWPNSGPAIMIPKKVIGDFDFQLKLKSDSAIIYLSAGIACWMSGSNDGADKNYAGGIWTVRGLDSALDAKEHAYTIGNGTVKSFTNVGTQVAWTTSTWLRLKREGATITHSRRTGDADAWTVMKQGTWDRSGGAAWLGIALGALNTQTAEFTVERIVATYTEYVG